MKYVYHSIGPLLCSIYHLMTFDIVAANSQAYHRGYRYPRYLFLTYRWYSNNWWLMETENENLTCSQQERQVVLPSMLAFLHYPYLEFEGLNVVTDTGIVSGKWVHVS